MDFSGGDEIRFERLGKAGVVTLTRPAALNAVTHRMVIALSRALDAWADDPGVALVVLKAEGRAFSAGGDILQIYEAGRAGNPPIGFFADEYRLNAKIARFPKPYVSLIDGIVMGGGVGISFHGSHRVLSENAQFAMPEVGIGFFPDVGGSFFLSRLKGSYGMYLGLTGTRIRAGDALRTGLATHSVRASDLPSILTALCQTGAPDKTLRHFARGAESEADEGSLFTIARLFSRERLDDLIVGLSQAAMLNDPIATRSLAAIGRASPTSIAVAFRQINTGAMLEIADCMKMEFRIVTRFLAGTDFYEGIRAAVVDKDQAAAWNPRTLAEIADEQVEAYFAPLPDGELTV